MLVKRRKRPGESAFGILLLLLSLFFAWQSYGISGFSALSSPGAFPMAVSATMVLAAVIVVIGNLRRKNEVEGGLGASARAFLANVTPGVVLAFTGMVIAYSVLLDPLGFLPASFLFLLVSIHYLHRGSVLFSVVVAVLSLAAIYAVFRLVFKVVLPEGIVPEREIIAWIENLFAGGAH